MNDRTRSVLAVTGLGLAGIALLAPKAMLLHFAATRLWVPVGPADATGALLADALVVLLVLGAAAIAMRRGAKTVALTAAAATLVLVLSLADIRVRQLWLRPLDLAIAAYGLRWSDDLSSSTGAFFETQAGFGLTFRRAAALVGLVHAAGWTLVLVARRARGSTPQPVVAPSARALAGFAAATVVLAAAVVAEPVRMPYGLQTHVVVSPVTAALQRAIVPADAAVPASGFEQPARDLSQVLAAPRRVHAGIAPFRNAIVVHFESCRWAGLGLDAVSEPDGAAAAPTPVPFLRGLAAEGMLFRCRVPVPHSSKATFAMTTGLYPAPGIEVLEAVHAPRAPFPAAFARDGGRATWAFSVQSLEFEGIGRMLANTGIEKRFGPADLVRLAGGAGGGARTSFGEDDILLARGPAATVAADGRPFYALLLTASAHHPYVFPGKKVVGDDSWEAYSEALSYADRCLAETLADFDRRGLLDDTVVAIVGDHGESFGEHGTFIHNNSLFEEETTVPLVLWAKGGRIRADGVRPARQIDIAPTVADLLGIGGGAEVQGVSLLRDDMPASFHASFFDGVAEALVEGSTKWARDVAGDRLVRYDLAADPSERNGTAVTDADERRAVLGRLAAFRAHQAELHGAER